MHLKSVLTFSLLTIVLNIFSQSDNDVLLSVNKSPVTVGEFKYIYEKNNGKEADYSEKSLNEYIDLYSKFKLKVARARDLKLDTIQTLNEELNGYKRQLANSYLTDKEIMEHLLNELKERQKQDVRFRHILILSKERDNDSLKKVALQKVNKVKSELSGGKKFEDVVKDYSEDKSSISNGGDLGYFTAMLPQGFYELENALYTLPIGKVSEPVKTTIGYHIIIVDHRRPARGTIEVAHILIRSEEGKKAEAKATIDELYNKIKNGEDFNSLATQFSQDKQTIKNGGVLPAFGINTYDKSFEEAAFSLQKDGDVSMPIETKAGWHILKRIKKPDYSNDANAYKKLHEANIKRDDRFAVARKKLVEDIKKSSGYSENLNVFNKYVESLNEEFLSFKWNPESSATSMKESLISYGGDYTYSVADFAAFSKKNTKTRLKYEKNAASVKEAAHALLAEFSEEKALDYEQKQLEIKYPDFKALMREYEEGILLFEATKQAVWDRANQDSIGLNTYYESNKHNYLTEEKGSLITVKLNMKDDKEAVKIHKVASEKSIEEIVKKYNKKEQVVTTTEEILDKSNSKFKDFTWAVKKPSALVKDPGGNGFTFKVINQILPVRPKTLKEARGYIIADYQDYLEKEWLTELANTYKVEVNKAILSKLIK